MKITPLEIRQKTFERKMRGFDKDEVIAFLKSLSQEWERVLDETKNMKLRLETTLQEVKKLREMEDSLFKTLKTAEATGANMMDQAQRSAELLLKESRLKADAMLHEARQKAKDTIEEAEVISKDTVEKMEERLRELGQAYKALQMYRDNLLNDLERIANDTADRARRAQASAPQFNPGRNGANAMSKKEIRTPSSSSFSTPPPVMTAPVEHPLQTVTPEEVEVRKELPNPVGTEASPLMQKSFFDELE